MFSPKALRKKPWQDLSLVKLTLFVVPQSCRALSFAEMTEQPAEPSTCHLVFGTGLVSLAPYP